MIRVLYPGSFDPIHLGHLDVVEQAAELFDHVVLVVMHNQEKPSGLFSIDDRMALIARSAAATGLADQVSVASHAGLAVEAAAELGVDFIVKGLRSAVDFEIEQQMALTNYSVTGVRTVYLPCRADRSFISSRFVREIARYGGAIDHLVPAPVATSLTTMFPPSTTRSHPGSSDDS